MSSFTGTFERGRKLIFDPNTPYVVTAGGTIAIETPPYQIPLSGAIEVDLITAPGLVYDVYYVGREKRLLTSFAAPAAGTILPLSPTVDPNLVKTYDVVFVGPKGDNGVEITVGPTRPATPSPNHVWIRVL